MTDFEKQNVNWSHRPAYNTNQLKILRPLIILAGPTAVGKTAASISFAKRIRGEIISADSMQVYRGMDIGSAKVKKEEMQNVTHHLIDILNPEEEFNVLIFQQLAKKAINEIYERGHIPILAGGTGFYIQAVLNDIDFTTEVSSPYREQYTKMAKEEGNHVLHEELQKIDPVSAEKIHENNVRRVIRALEFYKMNGYPLSEHNEEERAKKSPYLFRYYVLTKDREVLYKRIGQRVDLMMEEGLLDEVKRLKDAGYTRKLVSMQGIGYKEILAFLEKEVTLEKAVEQIKESTRHFAKRQLTWFRREKEVTWIDVDKFTNQDELVEYLLQDYCLTVENKICEGTDQVEMPAEKK